jgi:Ca2+-binding EF-hand superfamily protein
VWFRKMDRNRDGDVSRKEFLFAAEEFRRLDRDGDGLISAAEAAKAGAPGGQKERR